MIYTDEQLNKLHEVLIDILKEIDRICKDSNISYFSHGGTTLGAIRHSNIIPWDDDVDIGMLREDYERFLKIAPNKLSKGYTLVHYSTYHNAPQYYAKIKKDNTEFIEEHTQDLNIHQGIFVDVFPFDYVPEGDTEFRKYSKRVDICEQLYIAKTITKATNFHGKEKKRIYGAIRTIIHCLLICIPKKKIIEIYEKEAEKYNESKTKYVASRGVKKDKILLDDLFPLKKHAFADFQINIPNNADNILKNKYGNYMELPPIEKRVGHTPLKLSFNSSAQMDNELTKPR